MVIARMWEEGEGGRRERGVEMVVVELVVGMMIGDGESN